DPERSGGGPADIGPPPPRPDRAASCSCIASRPTCGIRRSVVRRPGNRMPLRVVTRSDTGTLWIVGTVRPAGAAQGIRVRRRAGADSAALAREEAAAIESDLLRAAWH